VAGGVASNYPDLLKPSGRDAAKSPECDACLARTNASVLRDFLGQSPFLHFAPVGPLSADFVVLCDLSPTTQSDAQVEAPEQKSGFEPQSQRYFQRRSAPSLCAVLQPDFSPQSLRHCLHDGQPQTHTLIVASAVENFLELNK